ncbi:MAG: TlpA disulfide reductase family protein [Bacteroidota bacterium]|jgi:thiol-disulfide isomerase/thioredoxin
MIQRSLFVGYLIFVLTSGSGCRPREPQQPAPAVASVDAARNQAGPVDPLDQVGLKNLIKERNGKILFLNIWATWCAPCVEEFPDLIKLARSYPGSEVEVVGISADYPDEVESKILPFIRKQNVPFRIYVAKFDHQEDFINSVDPSWSGALPTTLVFDAQGKRRYFIVGAGTFEKFKRVVDSVRTLR